MSNEELQRQIDELKRTVARLQSGETRYESMAVRMKRIRNKAFERYYGNWYFLGIRKSRFALMVNRGLITII